MASVRPGGAGLAVLACLALPLAFFPGFATFTTTPMAGQTWELQDPVVSEYNFSPGLAVVRYEAFRHGQLLWSGLRGLGQPLLGNEIQAAPLFPLTWLLAFVPEREYWNVLVLVRFAVAGLGAYLLAHQRMGLPRLASLAFVLNLIYGVNVLRWMNHPWSNGFVSGLWYLYALDRLQETAREPWGRRRSTSVLLVALAVYALVTCGFPEGAALGGLLAGLVHATRLVGSAFTTGLPLRAYASDVAAAHAIGFAVSSPQTFAMVEFIQQTAERLEGGWRGGIGLVQFGQENFKGGPDSAVSIFGKGLEAYSMHVFGAVALSLCALGILVCLRRPRRLGVWDAGAAVVLVFAVLKMFPVWPAFNELVGGLPVFKQSYFPLYFVPLFLWTFSWFAARGVAAVEQAPLPADGPGWRRIRAVLATGLLLALGVELWLNRPRVYERLERYWARTGPDEAGRAAVATAALRGIPPHELRRLEPFGRNVSLGLATADNGAPAVVPGRLQRLRTTLFEVEWEGRLPLGAPKAPYSVRAASINVFNGWIGPEDWFRDDLVSIVQRDDERLDLDLGSLPRCYLAAACVPVSGADASAAALEDPAQFSLGTAWIEGMDDGEKAVCSQPRAETRRVPIVADEGTRVTLALVNGPGVLVLNDAFYPGWRAYDERTLTTLPIRAANLAFRAVILKEARPYTVVFRYIPAWLDFSLFLVLAGLVAAAAMIVSTRSAPPPPDDLTRRAG